MEDTTSTPRLQPIGWLGSLLYFAIPSVIFSWFILWLGPWMMRNGVSQLVTFVVVYGGPLLLMLIAALTWYRLEGNPWTWPAFRDRMRLRMPTGKVWLWTLGLLVVATGSAMVIGPVARLFAGLHFYTPAPEFYALRQGIIDGTFGGMAMHGRWDVFVMMVLLLLFLNIGGEELWWRSIILPRQELAFGKWAWLVNGLLWNLFHFFYHTDAASIVGYLAATVPLAFVAQRSKSTWPGIIVHFITNRASLLGIYHAITS